MFRGLKGFGIRGALRKIFERFSEVSWSFFGSFCSVSVRSGVGGGCGDGQDGMQKPSVGGDGAAAAHHGAAARAEGAGA